MGLAYQDGTSPVTLQIGTVRPNEGLTRDVPAWYVSDMPALKTFAEVIALWPTMVAMAADLGVEEGEPRKWKHRGQIPAHHFQPLLRAAERRGFRDVNLGVLLDLTAQRAAERQEKRKARHTRSKVARPVPECKAIPTEGACDVL